MEIEGIIIDKQTNAVVPSSNVAEPNNAATNGNEQESLGVARSKSTLRQQPSPLSKKYPSNDLLAVSSYDLHKLSKSELDGSEGESDLDDEEQVPDDVIVELCNIHKTYLLGIEGVPALRGVSLQIMRGEFVVVFGTSGGGKTSLLNILGTIDKPTKGEMKICGTIINSRTSDETLSKLRLSRLGFVFQTFNLISSLTSQENVELPMVLKGTVPSVERRYTSQQSLARVGLGHRLDHYPSQLSGGEQQRVTIARAIANKPELLLLDEPTGDLDTQNTLKVLDLLVQLNKEEGMTMVMVTHDMYLKNFADRVVWMRDGKIAKVETISEERQTEAIADLRQKIQDLKQGKLKISHEEMNPVPMDQKQMLPASWVKTEIRVPTSYKPVEFQSQKHIRKSTTLTTPSTKTLISPNSTIVRTESPANTTSVSPVAVIMKQERDLKSPDSGVGSTITAQTNEKPPNIPASFLPSFGNLNLEESFNSTAPLRQPRQDPSIQSNLYQEAGQQPPL